MNRVVITGMGIISSLGSNKSEVLKSLKSAKSGIVFSEKYSEIVHSYSVNLVSCIFQQYYYTMLYEL